MAVIEAHSLVSNPAVQSEVLNYTEAVCANFPTFADACKVTIPMHAAQPACACVLACVLHLWMHRQVPVRAK